MTEPDLLAELRALRRDLAPRLPSGPVYWTLVMVPVWVAVVFYIPDFTFARAAVYGFMAAIATDEAWSFASGMVALLSALCGAVRHPHGRTVGLALLGAWNGAIAFCLFAAVPTNIGTVAFMALATLCAILFWRSW